MKRAHIGLRPLRTITTGSLPALLVGIGLPVELERLGIPVEVLVTVTAGGEETKELELEGDGVEWSQSGVGEVEGRVEGDTMEGETEDEDGNAGTPVLLGEILGVGTTV